jgi:hypothetical protein
VKERRDRASVETVVRENKSGLGRDAWNQALGGNAGDLVNRREIGRVAEGDSKP